MAKSEYTDLTYFMIYGYKLVKNSENNCDYGNREYYLKNMKYEKSSNI